MTESTIELSPATLAEAAERTEEARCFIRLVHQADLNKIDAAIITASLRVIARLLKEAADLESGILLTSRLSKDQ